jgi:hypothetical protein
MWWLFDHEDDEDDEDNQYQQRKKRCDVNKGDRGSNKYKTKALRDPTSRFTRTQNGVRG